MKRVRYAFASLAAVVLLYGCDQGIDPISEVAPGADASAPSITISKPTQGVEIQVLETVTSVDIDFEVTDDIEISTVEVWVDDKMIKTYSNFVDYRRLIVKDLSYDQIDDGAHTLVVKATDMDGKTTEAEVNFTKSPAYVPLYENEAFYMPFDGDFTDRISFITAAETGSPGYAGEAFQGSNSFKGAPESFLTFPTDGLLSQSFSGAFWYKISGDPGRAGILVVGDDAENRFQGFRLFREGSATEQRIKLNVGNGTGETWNDGGVINVGSGGWVHIAFTISNEETVVYINGEAVNTGTMSAPVDWTGCETLWIGNGGDTFSYWNHLHDNSPMDELRFFNKTLTAEEVQELLGDQNTFTGEFAGEMFYMPFDGDYINMATGTEATEVGDTGFAGEAVEGESAYAGAVDSYLTFPTTNLTTEEFSATMWYKLTADPTRAGILAISPEDPDNAEYPVKQNNRNSGFRLLREGDATRQIFKLNVGTGDGNEWADGGDAAALDPATATDWVHLAFTISSDKAVVYIDGVMVAEKDLPGFDWTGCDLLSIGSGAPRFTGWNHLSDISYIDELRFYDRVLTLEDVQTIMNSDL